MLSHSHPVTLVSLSRIGILKFVPEICECVSCRQHCRVSWLKQRISGNPMAISSQSLVWPPIQIHAFLRRNERRRATKFPLSLEIPLLYKSLRAFHLQIWRPELCVLHQYVQRLTTMRIKVNWGLKYKKTSCKILIKVRRFFKSSVVSTPFDTIMKNKLCKHIYGWHTKKESGCSAERIGVELKPKLRHGFVVKSCYDDYLKLFWDGPRSTLWLCLEKEIGRIFHVLLMQAWRERHFALERDEEKRFKSTTKGLNGMKK